MNRFEAYFFDFDGTIGYTETDIRSAWLQAIEKLNLPRGEFDKKFRVGPSLQETAAMLYPELSIEENKQLQLAYKSFYDDKDDYRAVPCLGIRETVEKLWCAGKKIYIVTNKRYKPLKKCIKLFDMAEMFHGIFCPDIISAGDHIKKSDMLALALKIANVSPASSLMIGDTPIDIQAASCCNCPACAVTWGYGEIKELHASEPDFIIDSPALLP